MREAPEKYRAGLLSALSDILDATDESGKIIGSMGEEAMAVLTSDADITVGSFFLKDDEFAEKQDIFFQGEDELTAASKEADLVYADLMYRRALAADTRLVPLVHCALSGC